MILHVMAIVARHNRKELAVLHALSAESPTGDVTADQRGDDQ